MRKKGLNSRLLGMVNPFKFIDGFSFKVNPEPKTTGRNEQCPCGSGKKYKKCCAISEQGRAS